MATYKAPLRDMNFVLNEVVGMDDLTALPRFAEVTPDVARGVLEEAAKFAERTMAPLNRSGDEEGCTFDNGKVTVPKGFKEAYQLYCDGGWQGLSLDPDYGGQGLPNLIGAPIREMMSSANMSLSLYSVLSEGAYGALHLHGSKELQRRFMPKLASGEWSGTMCLTEPHAGSDVGLARTKAVPAADGSYRISGTKIFITGGEHDMSRNIIHLVLARLPDALPGIRGISLFLVPKFLVTPDGGVGARNGVRCASIEHKMGIKASATCVMNFENAVGFLVGKEHQGIQHMFTMMNAARLAVGFEGLGLAEYATQNAIEYAKERKQGRPLTRRGEAMADATPIIRHADVRRMLLTMKAYTEGCRMLMYEALKQVDLSGYHPDARAREAATDYVDLLTPVIKGFGTDIGFEVASLGMQVYGGAGYVREAGMEQTARDARIAMIYEGTNGIQALDLIGRKLPMHNGRLLQRFFHPIEEFLGSHGKDAELAFIVKPLSVALSRMQEVTGWLAQKGLANPDEAAAGATDYMRLFGLVALGYFWTRTAAVAHGKNDSFYRGKLATARFYAERILPQTHALAAAVTAGAAAVMEPEETLF